LITKSNNQMSSKALPIAILLVLSITTSVPAQITYPDPQLPADTPKLFAKGILSDGLSNRDFAISPSGDEIFFTLQQVRFVTSTILYIRKQNGQWSKPIVAPFSGKYRDLEAAFSPDGQTIYFSSDRPVKDNVSKEDFDIWKVKHLSSGIFGQPENLGTTVNTDKNEFYPSVSKYGNLYFTVEASYGKGSEDIVVCKLTDSGYTKPVSLPEDINTKHDEFNAFIDPDEQFIIFSSYGRPDDMGRGDLYISHRGKSGSWLPVKHLPAPINSSGIDYCPLVTPDKKYLIFTSGRMNKELTNAESKTYDQLKELLNSPGNGLDDIYWVKFNKEW
jgi:Tol biopolymer transport system component